MERDFETIEEIENRIDELKWKALPFFERLVWKKESIQGKKFYTKKRLRELRWFIISCNVTLILFALFTTYLFLNPSVSLGLRAFCLVVLIVFVAQKVELRMRLNFLEEARFLKQLKKELK